MEGERANMDHVDIWMKELVVRMKEHVKVNHFNRTFLRKVQSMFVIDQQINGCCVVKDLLLLFLGDVLF